MKIHFLIYKYMATNSSEILTFPFKVKKKSGKPFKSMLKINTAVGTVKNENDPNKKDAFIFKEDNSVVNVDMCDIVDI